MVRLGIIVAATSKTMGIGSKGIIPWHYPEDLKRFKRITQHSAILMGRGTWESLPVKPLPNRFNIVVSKTIDTSTLLSKKPDLICSSPEEAIKYCDDNHIPFLWIIGGEAIYKYFINSSLIEVIHLTLIPENETYKCDKFFPKIPLTFTELKYESSKDTINPLEFVTYQRNEHFPVNFVGYCDGVPCRDS